jgi:CBS domain-containing protein
MGDQQVKSLSTDVRQEFLRHLLSDIRALEVMLQDRMIESGVVRIGAEQECCLAGADLRPSMNGPRLLAATTDRHFTTELARWNIEINLDPLQTGPGCLDSMSGQLRSLLAQANELARTFQDRIMITGIMPTIRQSDLDFRYMTPNPRYRLIDSILKEMRGQNFHLYIEGVDEINLRHDSILFEACNTSFQCHLQVNPDEFADRYNWSQIISGPVLAACVNSPILMGRELWSETRIALFRQSIDIRNAGRYISHQEPRVAFGQHWIQSCVTEIFKRDIASYPTIITADLGQESSLDLLARGEVPRLRAMNLHNGTLYKWNRACYGISEGKPHLRIENRYLSAGPSAIDEMANLAFWAGLMLGMPEECRSAWHKHFWFQDVRGNFLKAARNGLTNELTWFGKPIDVTSLIVDHLLPLADTGLTKNGVPAEEASRWLRIIDERVRSGQTGAQWIVDSYRSLRNRHSTEESMLLIGLAMLDNSLGDEPGHRWKTPCGTSYSRIARRELRVESLMVGDVVSVQEDDLAELASTLMAWNSFHHLPVQDSKGMLRGVISAADIESLKARDGDAAANALVSDLMSYDVVTVSPETSLEKAAKLMHVNNIGSLPVVCDGRVVGILTANDLARANN